VAPIINRRLALVRWLSITSAISIGLLSLATGTAAAASDRTLGSAERSATNSHSRPQPHAVTQAQQRATQPAGTTAAVTCNDQWNAVPSQNSAFAGANQNNELNSVSALSSTDAYAVGDADTGSAHIPYPQAEHWDGSAWTETSNPAAPTGWASGDMRLLSVTAVATNNVWAVGFWKINNNAGMLRHVLIEHFDGTNWSAVAETTANNPASTSNSLFGVKFFSATDIWAVGDAVDLSTTPATGTPLIEHFDGTSWTTQTAGAATSFAYLSDVLPLAATDVYAVGGQGNQTLIEHYNGIAWTTVTGPFPLPNTNGAFFSDIAGVAGDLWAVGGQFKSTTTDSTLIWHYDGTNWTAVPSPTPDLSADLIGVRYGAANDVWAVGASAYKLASSTSHELDFTLIEHWDGTHWYQVIGPNPSNHQVLFDAAIAGPNQVLAVGFSQDAEGGMAANTLAADLCEPTPAVTSLNPDHGNSAGGNAVQIIGTGLLYPRSVKFGTLSATSVTINSDRMITAAPPAQPTGTVVNVTVGNMAGTSATGAGNQYTYFGPGAWENAGGVLASGPAASTWGSPRLDAFVAGTDGVLYHRFYDGTTWTWESLPGEKPTSDASVISPANGQIYVFMRGHDNALYYRNFTAAAWSASWTRLGGVLASEPAAVSVGGGTIIIFVQGADNHLWYYTLGGATPGWSNAGGMLAAAPAAVSVSAGQANAFVLGTDRALWEWVSSAPANMQWNDLAGQIIGRPAATSRDGTNLDVFVDGVDGQLWHWFTPGINMNNWELVGGRLGSAPAASSWGGGRLDVAVRGTDSHLWHAWSSGGAWSWEGLGGLIVGSPAEVTWGTNRLDMFVRGTDNHLWHLPFS